MTDVFRAKYRELSNDERATLESVKADATRMLESINAFARDPRCAAIAKTKLEEAVMWAVKAITA